MYVQRVTAQSAAVSGSGSGATTTITLPASFVPAAGCVYDVLLRTQVPSETDGTIIAISNGSSAYSLLQRGTGSYARSRALGWRQVLRVQFFADPEHYVLLGVRG